MKNYYSSYKRGSRNLRGLAASYQAEVSHSIATKTAKTDKSTRQGTEHTQRTQQMKDFDEFEDDFDDIQDSLFISYEEQRKIHQLLQFARKGKINQANAFQIPVKVINPEFIHNNNLRFWKFASELLFASMCIYDKRVQNMFQTTNKVFDHLVRAKNNDETEANPEQPYYIKSRRKKEELMKIQIAQMGASKNIKFVQIGQFNRQIPQKLNIKNESLQFNKSPLFQKALKAFDSNQLKNLFLNVFEQSKTLQITFFHEIAAYDGAKLQKLQQIKQSFHEQECLPGFIEEELKRLNFVIRNEEIYKNVSIHLKQNLQGVREERSSYLDFCHQINTLNCKDFDIADKINDQITELNEPQSMATSNNSKFSFNFVTNEDIGKCLSQQLNHSIQNINSNNHYAASQKHSRSFLHIQQNDYSIMMPQQLEFKGLKLFRKNSKPARLRKKPQKSKDIQIQLKFEQQQTRENIFKAVKDNMAESRYFEDKFLLAKAMDPFIEIHRIRGKILKGNKQNFDFNYSQSKKTLIVQAENNNQPFVYPNDNNELQVMPSSNNMIPHDSYQSIVLSNISTQGLNNLKTYGLRSIRQIKQSLYNKLQSKKQLKLSEIDVPISPNSAFLILLHLVNQNEFKIKSIENEQDAILYYGQY